ncbi:MAG: phosphohydrolase [Patescibacteria group bacterium]
MITRNQALALIREHVKNENIVKHMLAVEALMAGVYDELKNRGRTEQELGGTREEWMMAGLLHDGDYCDEVPMAEQGIKITQWAREKGYEIPENVAQAMAAHNWDNTGVEPKTLMDWAIFCGDSLTGLIVAAALVLPSKKINDLTVESVLKRFKEPSFARGTRREEIKMCQEKLDLTLEEFIGIALKSMQIIADDLGL